MHPASRATGVPLVLLAASLWATVGVAAQLVPAASEFPPEILGFARTAIAGPVLLLVAIIVPGPKAIRLTRLNPAGLVVFATSNAIFQIGLFRCFAILGVTVTVYLTVCLPPLMAMVWNWLRQRESVGVGNVLALAHAVTGLWLIGHGFAFGGTGMPSSEGIVMAIIASLAFVTMTDAARTLGRTEPPLLITGAGLTLSSALLLLTLPVIGVASLSVMTAALGDPTILGLAIYLGLGPTALAYVCYCAGIARCRSVLVGLIASMIEPAIAAVLAISILSDKPSMAEAVGCSLLMIAILILWQSERGLARRRIEAASAAS
ncbi:MAG: EamA family transporter, partial [bacterium]